LGFLSRSSRLFGELAPKNLRRQLLILSPQPVILLDQLMVIIGLVLYYIFIVINHFDHFISDFGRIAHGDFHGEAVVSLGVDLVVGGFDHEGELLFVI